MQSPDGVVGGSKDGNPRLFGAGTTSSRLFGGQGAMQWAGSTPRPTTENHGLFCSPAR